MTRQRGRQRGRWWGGGGAPAPGTSLPEFAIAPSVFYHAHLQGGAVTKSGDRVTACPDLQGLAAASGLAVDGVTLIGPTEMTDALGRKFWRFSGATAMFVSNALQSVSSQAHGIFYVGRLHKHRATSVFMSWRYISYTNDATNTTSAEINGGLRARVTSSGAPNFNNVMNADAVNGWKMVPGCQMHVGGIASRTAALGGQRYYMNTETATNTAAISLQTAIRGAVIGAQAAAGNSYTAPSLGAGNWFDLYCFGIWSQTLTNAQADAIAAALVESYGIVPLTRQLVLSGDSITDGVVTTLGATTSGDNIGMVLTNPGAEYVPGDVRVINIGTAGDGVTQMQTKKNAAQSVFGSISNSWRFPGGPANNIVAPQIGRNDMGFLNIAATAHYANVNAAINSTTAGQEGFLQRGFKVALVSNIQSNGASGAADADGNVNIVQRINLYRSLIMDTMTLVPTSAFLTAVEANTSQTYEGLVTVLPVSHIQSSAGQFPFRDQTDYANPPAAGFFDSDNTHLLPAGFALEVSGGITPALGFGSLF